MSERIRIIKCGVSSRNAKIVKEYMWILENDKARANPIRMGKNELSKEVLKGRYDAFVSEKGLREVKVEAFVSDDGSFYLKTVPDETELNNLEWLPKYEV